ncbi:hypothetical protein Tco_0882055 [Tanacetum coccineum]
MFLLKDMDQDSAHMVAASKVLMLKLEDVNQKLLRSLSPEWNTHAVVWRNKADLDTMSMDDLYNNLKVYEPEVKGMSSSSSSTQNMAFVSSSNNNTSNTNEAVNTAHGVSTASTQLVKDKYESTRLVEDLDLVLWNDLKSMFEPHVEDNVWKNQQDYKVLSWKLYDSCRVHFLRMQHVQIYMLVEKKYPLTPSTLTMMLEKKLMIDYESKMAYQLLKFIVK